MDRDLRVPCGRTKDGYLLCLDELDPAVSYTGEHALYCPSCGGQLVVRHYRKNKTLCGQVYCLAHKASDVNSCHGVGGETLIHLLTKRAFLDLIGREFPLPFPYDLRLRLDHSQWAFPWVLTDALVEQPFLVWDEKRERNVRKQPDVSAQFVCGAFPVPVSVEICVTHDKSEDDLTLLKQLGRPVLEIYPDLIVDDSRLSDPAYVANLRFSCEYYLMSDDEHFRMSWRGTFPKELALSLARRNKRHDVPAAIRSYHERPLWEWSDPSVDAGALVVYGRYPSIDRMVECIRTRERRRVERIEQLAAAAQQLREQKMPQRRAPVRDLSGVPGVKPILWPVWPQDTDWPGTKPSLQPVTTQVPPWITVDITCDMTRCVDVAWYMGRLRQAVYDTVYALLPIFTCLYLTCPRDGVMSTKALYVAELGLRMQALKYHMVPVSQNETSVLWRMTNTYRRLMTFALPLDRDGLPGGVALATRTWSGTLDVTMTARLMCPRDAWFCVADDAFEWDLYARLVQRLDAAYQLDADGCDERGGL